MITNAESHVETNKDAIPNACESGKAATSHNSKHPGQQLFSDLSVCTKHSNKKFESEPSISSQNFASGIKSAELIETDVRNTMSEQSAQGLDCAEALQVYLMTECHQHLETMQQDWLDPAAFASYYPFAYATYCLVCQLVKQGKMSQVDVDQIVARCCQANTCAHPSVRPGTRPLCAGVAARLAALRDRIRATGTALLPPSRAVLGPPFIPALDLLRSLVLDAGGSASATAADCGRAPESRKRRHSEIDCPGAETR